MTHSSLALLANRLSFVGNERVPAVNKTQQNIITGVGLKHVDLLRRQATPLARGVAHRKEERDLIRGDPMPRGVVIVLHGDPTLMQVGKTGIVFSTLACAEAAGRKLCPGGVRVSVIVA